MRKTAVAVALLLVASLGIVVPAAAAATVASDPKVVIIVGATHGATAHYRTYADHAYAEAIKYTSNVVKVYSPNATWAKVKAAVAGASVVIYMGHGNGWPSPYTYDPKYTTKDGFGLNAVAGNGDYNNKYYGEPYVSTLDLAPGAIVLLHHLCYASGNSSSGDPEPTIPVARQRADNYAAGFLKAGAAAVIADGYSGPEGYLQALFTTHRSIEDVWRTMPNLNGNIVSFPSVRTPGATVYQDPITPTSGFFRALTIGALGVTTDEVISAGHGDTGADPTDLLIPGNASVATDGASLYTAPDTTAEPAATLPVGTRLRTVDGPTQATAAGAPLVHVRGIDDPAITGFMLAGDLAARDSAAPIARGLDPGGPFSPNGDGRVEGTTIRARFTEPVAWTLRVRDGAGVILLEKTGSGITLMVPWDGLVAGHPVADGTLAVSVTGVDAWGNPPAQTTRELVVDTAAPKLTGLAPAAGAASWFSPNGDGDRDTIALTATNSEPGSLIARVLDGGGHAVRTLTVPNGSAPASLTWDGRDTAGARVPDGAYAVRVVPRDAAGNTGTAQDRMVKVIAALRAVATSKAIFFPQDLDRLAPGTTLSFALVRPMTVTWTLRDAAGRIVVTHLSDVALPAGTRTWWFTGRRPDGTMLPRGRYFAVVTASDGTLTATQSVAVEVDAFRQKLSDATPRRGQAIIVTVISAEALARAPRLYIYQPHLARWSVTMTRIGNRTYRATIRMKASGGTGLVRIKAWGRDILGGAQSTSKVYPLH